MKKFMIFMAQIVAMSAVVMSAQATTVKFYLPQNFDPPRNEIDMDEFECLAKNVYFEARNQRAKAMAAVANVTLNRVASPDFPDSVCEVVTQGPLDGSEISKHRCQFSWYCDGKPDVAPVNDDWPEVQAWQWAQMIAEITLLGEVPDNTNGSTYYHAEYVEPAWSSQFTQVATVGEHLFYVHN